MDYNNIFQDFLNNFVGVVTQQICNVIIEFDIIPSVHLCQSQIKILNILSIKFITPTVQGQSMGRS